MGKIKIRKKTNSAENVSSKVSDDVNRSTNVLPRNKKITVNEAEKIGELERKSKDDGSLLDRIDRTVPPKYESWSEDVNDAALRIAEEFPYNEVSVAYDAKLAPHIHGWIQDRYRNFQWLIDNYVMEVAAWYARNKLDTKVKIVKIVDNIDITKYKIVRVDLKRLHRLENYPNQPFINAIFLSEDYLDDAVYWLEDSEWIIDDEDVRVNLGRFGGVLIAWESWNVPVVLVTYLPFRNKGIYKAKLEAEKITALEEDLKLRLIHTYRTRVETLEAKVDEKEREAKQWKKMYSDSDKNISLILRREVERRGYTRSKLNTTRFGDINIILIFLLIAIGILAIVGLVY